MTQTYTHVLIRRTSQKAFAKNHKVNRVTSTSDQGDRATSASFYDKYQETKHTRKLLHQLCFSFHDTKKGMASFSSMQIKSKNLKYSVGKEM